MIVAEAPEQGKYLRPCALLWTDRAHTPDLFNMEGRVLLVMRRFMFLVLH